MFKYLIVAFDINRTPARYFAAYKDVGETCIIIWTADFLRAKWFDAEDAKIEAVLLSGLYPDYIVEAQQVNDVALGRR